jgi:hypothetical protein
MEFRIREGWGERYGVTLWYNPADGRIVDWGEYLALPKEERRGFVKAGRFYEDGKLCITLCPAHGVWERHEVHYSPFHRLALERARDCVELSRIEGLWTLSHTLARAIVEGAAPDTVIRLLRGTVLRQRDGLRAIRLLDVASEFPELRDGVERLRGELEPMIIAKGLKGRTPRFGGRDERGRGRRDSDRPEDGRPEMSLLRKALEGGGRGRSIHLEVRGGWEIPQGGLRPLWPLLRKLWRGGSG